MQRFLSLLTCSAVLLAVEVFVGRSDWVWTYRQSSPVWVQEQIETRLIAPAPAPAVVVLGNSRIMSAVDTEVLAASLDLKPGATLNAAITEGTPFDCYNMYLRNRERFRAARLILVGLDSWQVRGDTPVHERVRRYARLPERIEFFTSSERRSLVAGGLWRTLDVNKPVLRMLMSATGGRTRRDIIRDGRSTWRPEGAPRTGPAQADDVEERFRAFYTGYVPGSTSLRPVEALLGLAADDGVSIVFCRVPARDAFMERVRVGAPEAEQALQQAVDAMQAASPGLRGSLIYGGASEVGIEAQQFYDYGHFVPSGARSMSRRLAADLVMKGYWSAD